ncbi:MAG: OB-fold domain-containing protein [Myxococcota bacterium]|nr:OB-fold domain-containing protein [Myxococcota bacterium]
MSRYMDGWMLPGLDDANRDFFTSGKIVVRECSDCKTIQHPPEDLCHECGGYEFRSREVAGTGTIYSHTVIRHPVHPDLVDRVPYTVVLVSLDELPAVRITGNLLEVAPADVRIGLAVRAVWEEIPGSDTGEALRLPQWVPA